MSFSPLAYLLQLQSYLSCFLCLLITCRIWEKVSLILVCGWLKSFIFFLSVKIRQRSFFHPREISDEPFYIILYQYWYLSFKFFSDWRRRRRATASFRLVVQFNSFKMQFHFTASNFGVCFFCRKWRLENRVFSFLEDYWFPCFVRRQRDYNGATLGSQQPGDWWRKRLRQNCLRTHGTFV